jgi:DNA-binding MarR family transcriptional regulator
MASAGWILRAPDKKDRRALRISLLPEGRKKYLEVRKIAVQLQTDVLKDWPEARREEFLENLELIAEQCRRIEVGLAKRR